MNSLEKEKLAFQQQVMEVPGLRKENERLQLQVQYLSSEVEINKADEQKMVKLENMVETYKNKVEIMNQTNKTIQVFHDFSWNE